MLNGNDENLYVGWELIAGEKVLYIKFKGHYDKQNVQITMNKCEELIIKNRPNKTVVVFNCLEMTNYDHDARPLLYEKVIEYKKDIDSLHTVVKSPLIMASIEIISFFSNFKIKYYTSMEKLEKRINKKLGKAI